MSISLIGFGFMKLLGGKKMLNSDNYSSNSCLMLLQLLCRNRVFLAKLWDVFLIIVGLFVSGSSSNRPLQVVVLWQVAVATDIHMTYDFSIFLLLMLILLYAHLLHYMHKFGFTNTNQYFRVTVFLGLVWSLFLLFRTTSS